MILPNVRASFGRNEANLILGLLARGDTEAREREEARLREAGFDALLDDPRTFNAVLSDRDIQAAPAPLVFYLLVRHTLLENGIRDRVIADYLAALLLNFSRQGRAYKIEDDAPESFYYLVDIIEAIESAHGRRAFLLQAHLGEFALWLSGLFPDYIAARVERRGAPGIDYYEELGAAGYRAAADYVEAKRYGLSEVYGACAERFPALRITLNRVADRYLFPAVGDPIPRLLRQVADQFRLRVQQN